MNQRKIAILMGVLMLLAASIGGYFLFADGPNATPQGLVVREKLEQERRKTRPEKPARNTKPSEIEGKTPAPSDEKAIETIEPTPEVVETSGESARVSVRVEVVHSGQANPEMKSLIEELYASGDDGDAIALVAEDGANYLSESALPMPTDTLLIQIRSKYDWAYRSFEDPKKGADGIITLPTIKIEVSELIGGDSAIITGVLQHRSGVSLATLDSITLSLDSETVALDAYQQSYEVKVKEDGSFELVIDREGRWDASIRKLTDADIEKLLISVSSGGETMHFQHRVGAAFDFGNAMIGGALVDFSLQVNLPPPLAWKGTPQEAGAVYAMSDSLGDSDRVSFSLSSTGTRAETSGEHAGKGIYRGRTLAPAETLVAKCSVNLFSYELQQELRFPEFLDLKDGDIKEVAFRIDAPAMSVAFVEFPEETKDKAFYYGFIDKASAVESLAALQKCQTWKDFDNQFSFNRSDDSDGAPVIFIPSDERQVLFVADYLMRAVTVDVSGAARVFHLKLDEKWLAAPKASDETASVIVHVERNKKSIPDEAELSVNYERWGSIYGTKRFSFGDSERIDLTFEGLDVGATLDFTLFDYHGKWGYETLRVSEGITIDTAAGSQEITLKLNAEPKFTGPIEGPFTFELLCGGQPFESDWVNTENSVSAENLGNHINQIFQTISESRLTRSAPTVYRVDLSVDAIATISAAYLGKFKDLELRFSAGYYKVTRAGTYNLPSGDGSSFTLRCTYRESSLALWEAAIPKNAARPIAFRLEQAPTIVEFEGQSQGYKWSLEDAEGKSVVDWVVGGRVAALAAGEYTWVAMDGDSPLEVSELLTVPDAPPITVRIPTLNNFDKSGEIHFELSEAERERVLGGRLSVGTSRGVARGRIAMSQRRDDFESRQNGGNYSSHLDGRTLKITNVPVNTKLWMQVFLSSGNLTFASYPEELIIVRAEGNEGAPTILKRELPVLYESSGYPWFPVIEDAQFRKGYQDIDDDDQGMLTEFYLNGKRVIDGAGLIVGKRYEVRVWIKVENSPEHAAALFCTIGRAGENTWDADTVERLQPIIKRIPDFTPQDREYLNDEPTEGPQPANGLGGG